MSGIHHELRSCPFCPESGSVQIFRVRSEGDADRVEHREKDFGCGREFIVTDWLVYATGGAVDYPLYAVV